MDEQTKDGLKQVLDELFGQLEEVDTRSTAILEFLKDADLASDERLAPYFEQAGRASSVKWLAARKRMEYLLTPIQKEEKKTEVRSKDSAEEMIGKRGEAEQKERMPEPGGATKKQSATEDNSAKNSNAENQEQAEMKAKAAEAGAASHEQTETNI